MIVANRVGDDCGFDADDNEVEVLWHGGEKTFPSTAKTELAYQIVAVVAERFDANRGEATQPELTVVKFRE
jgi:phosphopantothenoylcysteine decarboxylase/phosphopantothenate--cysteine ligase